ncbi:hypothetical protein [Halovivax cerinus]|uniref:Uncharacterized protein n=1 Tax=Halovivax cerinus TaxID=1487865 RepID=A0ABD5NK33_9EURY|nr:hypothetical protein [Halovivax cerinus]
MGIDDSTGTEPTVYATAGMVEALLDLASEAQPDRVSTGISTVSAGDLEGEEATVLPAETPVFAEYLIPDPGNSLTHVFGVELSTPNRNTQGRFLSHPDGVLDLTLRDDLAAVVIVAVPPWNPADDSLAAFDRSGERLPLELIDAEPPERPFES